MAFGVVHLLIAWLALQLAFGDRSEDASSDGAIRELAPQPFGEVLVWLVALGMFLLVVWRLLEAAMGHQDEDGAKRTGKRLVLVRQGGRLRRHRRQRAYRSRSAPARAAAARTR